jgi:hypothetical protein
MYELRTRPHAIGEFDLANDAEIKDILARARFAGANESAVNMPAAEHCDVRFDDESLAIVFEQLKIPATLPIAVEELAPHYLDPQLFGT